ncbi:hypothetical protein A3770_02p13290 [Chloropicon primus]|uniref:MICOS complex subunit MIC60 n=1 Tax=Chloropicon primus TaxID=1764295 RepID=A0A5B8MEW1_9CHLO|nr:hypothetical protein A3770_02p13290 [Chloropicon primus]|eukprot:QDZ18811.1 hypothetical protein A3770_02p13290 [Chloropicon primus]
MWRRIAKVAEEVSLVEARRGKASAASTLKGITSCACRETQQNLNQGGGPIVPSCRGYSSVGGPEGVKPNLLQHKPTKAERKPVAEAASVLSEASTGTNSKTKWLLHPQLPVDVRAVGALVAGASGFYLYNLDGDTAKPKVEEELQVERGFEEDDVDASVTILDERLSPEEEAEDVTAELAVAQNMEEEVEEVVASEEEASAPVSAVAPEEAGEGGNVPEEQPAAAVASEEGEEVDPDQAKQAELVANLLQDVLTGKVVEEVQDQTSTSVQDEAAEVQRSAGGEDAVGEASSTSEPAPLHVADLEAKEGSAPSPEDVVEAAAELAMSHEEASEEVAGEEATEPVVEAAAELAMSHEEASEEIVGEEGTEPATEPVTMEEGSSPVIDDVAVETRDEQTECTVLSQDEVAVEEEVPPPPQIGEDPREIVWKKIEAQNLVSDAVSKGEDPGENWELYGAMHRQAAHDAEVFNSMIMEIVKQYEEEIDDIIGDLRRMESNKEKLESDISQLAIQHREDLRAEYVRGEVRRLESNKKQAEEYLRTTAKAMVREREIMLGQLDEARMKLNSLKVAFSKRSEEGKRGNDSHQLAQAVLSIKHKTGEGLPFADALEVLGPLAKDDEFIALVVASIPSHVAEKGAMSSTQLQEWFWEVEKDAARVALLPAEGAGFLSTMLSYAASFARVREDSSGEADAEGGVESALSAARALITDGKFYESAALLEKSFGSTSAMAIFSEWVQAARDRARVDQAVMVLEASAVTKAKSLS